LDLLKSLEDGLSVNKTGCTGLLAYLISWGVVSIAPKTASANAANARVRVG